ncbi:hypothetical protein Ea357_038 [Erwinia phage Ea35-70]|jgi:hypothetical protein|uniref:Uncharacterized protein n=1 Tax=Erwinia phage Ea35-70 TaxID=1429768 RepID=W6AR43_9CAUD|nr:hypothetical protein Ea357_038 [Erwinia phage Ea35-70]AHI60188.1 hypothetical protein Ea357_038 [Erwinia phage Ea35-70]
MNYIYRANGHLFVLLYHIPVLDVDPNKMTHWERVLHYRPLTIALGAEETAAVAFMPVHLELSGWSMTTDEGEFYDGIYVIWEGKLYLTQNDEMCLIEEIPTLFHNLMPSAYHQQMVRYTQPFEFINGLDHRKLRTLKATAETANSFLRMMDRFEQAVECHYINERTNLMASTEMPLSFIPRQRGAVINEPIVLH